MNMNMHSEPQAPPHSLSIVLPCWNPPGPKKHHVLGYKRDQLHTAIVYHLVINIIQSPSRRTVAGGLRKSRQEHGTTKKATSQIRLFTPGFCLSHTEIPSVQVEHPIDGPNPSAFPVALPCHPPAAGGLLRSYCVSLLRFPPNLETFVPSLPQSALRPRGREVAVAVKAKCRICNSFHFCPRTTSILGATNMTNAA
jgi:hypothetical protein